MATARERQVAWELGRRERQMSAVADTERFERQVREAVPLGRVGRYVGVGLLGRAVIVVPGRGWLVALRHRYSLEPGRWRFAWSAVEPVVASLNDALWALSGAHAERRPVKSERDVVEWVLTQAVFEAVRDRTIPDGVMPAGRERRPSFAAGGMVYNGTNWERR